MSLNIAFFLLHICFANVQKVEKPLYGSNWQREKVISARKRLQVLAQEQNMFPWEHMAIVSGYTP